MTRKLIREEITPCSWSWSGCLLPIYYSRYLSLTLFVTFNILPFFCSKSVITAISVVWVLFIRICWLYGFKSVQQKQDIRCTLTYTPFLEAEQGNNQLQTFPAKQSRGSSQWIKTFNVRFGNDQHINLKFRNIFTHKNKIYFS